MIVVDTNIIAYLCITGELNADAASLWRLEPHWAAPTLWRSEFRNILTQYIKRKFMSLEYAVNTFSEAADIFQEREYQPATKEILKLAKASGCTAYDCEFVALAQQLDCPLVTNDKAILRAFPRNAFSLSDFIK